MQYSYYAVQESRHLNILGAVAWEIAMVEVLLQ